MVLIAVLILATLAGAAAAAEPRAHWERLAVEGGSELLTLFSVIPGEDATSAQEEIPVLSVLRDTLGDDEPSNDRLRYVWLLVDQKGGGLPDWLAGRRNSGEMPRPLVDLSSPGKDVWRTALRSVVQRALLDPQGFGVRASSRGFLSDRRTSRAVRIYEVQTILQRLRDDAQTGPLSPREYDQVLARIMLVERPLGGLVRNSALDRVVQRQFSVRNQSLGKNWELLRQRAEAESLVFQPINGAGGPAVAAMVWISRQDLEEPRQRKFRSKFLRISDPWSDPALHQWDGYTENWCFDSAGRRTIDGRDAVACEELIPLALYSLDHPKAPLLLIDFRSHWKRSIWETIRLILEGFPRTALGVTSYANPEIRGAQLAANFVRSRHGAPVRRPARLRAAASTRQIIASAPQLTQEMRSDLTQRLGLPAASTSDRYEALVAWASSHDGLPRRIEKDRGRELARLRYPTKSRWLNALTIVTVGAYRDRIKPSPEGLALLDRERRLETAVDAIEGALASSPRIEVGTDMDRVWKAAHTLATVPSVVPSMRERIDDALKRLSEQPIKNEGGPELIVKNRLPGSVPLQTIVETEVLD